MDKKKLILIFVILIVLVAGAFFLINGFSNNPNTIKFDAAEFSLPEGYHTSIKVSSSVAETINITNGTNVIYIVEYKNEGDINQMINNYLDRMNSNNMSATVSQAHIGDTEVHVSNVENNTRIHQYWFNKNGHLYSIYTWNGDNNTDAIINSLIESIEFPIF